LDERLIGAICQVGSYYLAYAADGSLIDKFASVGNAIDAIQAMQRGRT
jgi:hypothetical protein